jgi:hypothetical protein
MAAVCPVISKLKKNGVKNGSSIYQTEKAGTFPRLANPN